MKNLKVTFYGQDNKKTKFDTMFRSENVLDKFLESYQYYGGFMRFDYDIWEDNCKERLPVLTNDDNSFSIVYNNLYPKFA